MEKSVRPIWPPLTFLLVANQRTLLHRSRTIQPLTSPTPPSAWLISIKKPLYIGITPLISPLLLAARRPTVLTKRRPAAAIPGTAPPTPRAPIHRPTPCRTWRAATPSSPCTSPSTTRHTPPLPRALAAVILGTEPSTLSPATTPTVTRMPTAVRRSIRYI